MSDESKEAKKKSAPRQQLTPDQKRAALVARREALVARVKEIDRLKRNLDRPKKMTRRQRAHLLCICASEIIARSKEHPGTRNGLYDLFRSLASKESVQNRKDKLLAITEWFAPEPSGKVKAE